MTRLTSLFLVPVIAAFLVLGGFAVRHSPALAYGKADQPLAQIEFSGNCDNPDFPFCAPEDQGGVGTGGIWLWFEIDASGTGDIAGAACIHTVGGRGLDGAFPIRGDVTWTMVTTSNPGADYPNAALPGIEDPNDTYYLVTVPALGGEQFLLPTTLGHYSGQPVPGVSLQLQVAP